jgi:hypothetical protein
MPNVQYLDAVCATWLVCLSSFYVGNFFKCLVCGTTKFELILSQQQCVVVGPCTDLAFNAKLPRSQFVKKKDFPDAYVQWEAK